MCLMRRTAHEKIPKNKISFDSVEFNYFNGIYFTQNAGFAKFP